MGKYLIFAHQGQPIGGMMTRPPQVPDACWPITSTWPSVKLPWKLSPQTADRWLFGPQEVPGGSFIVNAIDRKARISHWFQPEQFQQKWEPVLRPELRKKTKNEH